VGAVLQTAALLVLSAGVGVARTPDAPPDWRWLIVTDGPEQEAERAALVAALRLLPRLPVRVAVIDATQAKPGVRPRLLALDAFIVVGSPVVYVVRQSLLLEGARRRSVIHVHALAAVLWHELAHVDGADEPAARRQEQALWTTFVRDQQIDGVAALRYLKALAERPDDRLLATGTIAPLPDRAAPPKRRESGAAPP
jgi:hypothetical protein